MAFTKQVPAISRAEHCSGEAVKRLGGTRRTRERGQNKGSQLSSTAAAPQASTADRPTGSPGQDYRALVYFHEHKNLIYCSSVPRDQNDSGLDTVRVTAQFHSCAMVLPKEFSYHCLQSYSRFMCCSGVPACYSPPWSGVFHDKNPLYSCSSSCVRQGV